MRIESVGSTYCFVSSPAGPAQVVRVAVVGGDPSREAVIDVVAPGLVTVPWRGVLDPARAGEPGGPTWAPRQDEGLAGPGRFTGAPPLPEGVVCEVAVVPTEGDPDRRRPGGALSVEVVVSDGVEEVRTPAEVILREPGHQMVMVPHFHYDPVWWNTQAGYTALDEVDWARDRREAFADNGLALVEAHLERARRDPDYAFVLAEVDYLKPYWDLYPDRREEIRGLLAEGRLEIVGGTYNEPNTNLTGVETAIRAVAYGLGFQRDVMGADPRTAWQLDVFGHDPQFPGIMAACGLDSSAWARGPFHQWGPKAETGSVTWMQFPSEFEWIAPNGLGLLTSYMPDHYSAGWELERATTLEGAMWRAYELFEDLASVAATRVTLLPVGTDYTPPGRFVTDVARTWSARYLWPRFTVGVPRQFFAAVRAELAAAGRRPLPETRDMNPLYTGKDVSFIDTKQAQRLVEAHLGEAEALSAIAALLGLPVAWRALDKAWRQVVFGAHHDGITGSESDQVYLDLLAGWREADELARAVATRAMAALTSAIDTRGAEGAIVVVDTSGADRSDLVEVPVPVGEMVGAEGEPAGEEVSDLEVLDDDGRPLASVVEPGPTPGEGRLRFLAEGVPAHGYRCFAVRRRPAGRRGDGVRPDAAGGPPATGGWEEVPGVRIANEFLEVAADPSRGGGLSSIEERTRGTEIVPPGEVAFELLVYPEYPAHPRFGEGPWHLVPSGPPVRSGTGSATVRAERSTLGERLVVEGEVAGFRYRQVATLFRGLRRLEVTLALSGFRDQDRLVRVRVPTTLRGGTPLSAVGDAVIARDFALIDVDVAEHPWTLDNPAAEWCGLGTTLVVEAGDPGRPVHRRAVGVAEVVAPPGRGDDPALRRLVVSLLRQGVTSTLDEAPANRYGALRGDSNLPDIRIAVGGPGVNPFTAQVLEAAPPAYAAALAAALERDGEAVLLVPGAGALEEVWQPSADLRAPDALAVVVVAGRDEAALERALRRLAAAVETGRVSIVEDPGLLPPREVPELTVALLNRGTPGFAVDTSGALHVSLLRASSGWPSGIWIDPPRRQAPDGSAFELEHWDHHYDLALVVGAGDWREAGIVAEARAYNRRLRGELVEPHAGPLGRRASFLAVVDAGGRRSEEQDGEGAGRESAGRSVGQVVVDVLKPSGHPLASGDGPGDEGPGVGGTSAGSGGGRAEGGQPGVVPEVEVTLRVHEATGHAAQADCVLGVPWVSWEKVDPIEQPSVATSPGGASGAGRGSGPSKEPLRLALDAGEIATYRLRLRPPAAWSRPAGERPDGAGSAVASAGPVGSGLGGGIELEPAQPVFSRYWLHNKGAAPLGNQPLAVHVLPRAVAAVPGSTVSLTAQVAASTARMTLAGEVEVVVPDGWDVVPPARLFSLAPSGFLRLPVEVSVPETTPPGRYFVAVQTTDPAGQRQEDVLTVDVAPVAEETGVGAPAVGPELEVTVLVEPDGGEAGGSPRLVLPAGEGSVVVEIRNRTAGEMRGELQAISPVETWVHCAPALQAFAVRPGEVDRRRIRVTAPAVGHLESWVLCKLVTFGRLYYSPAVALVLGRPERSVAAAARGSTGPAE